MVEDTKRKQVRLIELECTADSEGHLWVSDLKRVKLQTNFPRKHTPITSPNSKTGLFQSSKNLKRPKRKPKARAYQAVGLASPRAQNRHHRKATASNASLSRSKHSHSSKALGLSHSFRTTGLSFCQANSSHDTASKKRFRPKKLQRTKTSHYFPGAKSLHKDR